MGQKYVSMPLVGNKNNKKCNPLSEKNHDLKIIWLLNTEHILIGSTYIFGLASATRR